MIFWNDLAVLLLATLRFKNILFYFLLYIGYLLGDLTKPSVI